MDINKIVEKLQINIPKDNIYLNELMSKHTTFKVGGKADIFVKANSVENIKYILDCAKKCNIPLTIIGNGSNILVKDNGIRGIVMRICNDEISIDKKENKVIVTVGAGLLNAKLAQILLKEKLTGYEFAAGIPGTIGGAIKMNAGAYGYEIKDIIVNVTFIDLEDNNTIKTYSNSEINFKYRHTIFTSKKVIILCATLNFTYGNQEQIAKKMEENLFLRKSKQPIEYPSAGSTFKRGDNYITAQLIDECGLKGVNVGGAEISMKHAGFIINKNNATANDIINLIDLTKKRVYEKFNENIELEIEIIGE